MQRNLFLLTASVIFMAALGAGLFLSGSPMKARAEKYDQQRLSDLQQITYALDEYWARSNANLPNSLEDLKKSLTTPTSSFYLSSITDPRTGAPYEYRPTIASRGYELCATFEADSQSSDRLPFRPPDQPFWQHGLGRTCFQLIVNARGKTTID